MVRAGFALSLAMAGCPAQRPPDPRPIPSAPAPSSTETATAAVVRSLEAPRAEPPSAIPASATPCGELACLAFDSPKAAFTFVVDASKPRVLAIGEAHAPKGSEGVDSSAKRFREALLPLLERRASDLIVELLMPAKNCQQAEKKVVENVEKPVTSGQKATNKNEYVELGERAKALAIQPWALTPSCEQYQAVAGAGEDGVTKMLSLIALLTRERAEVLLGKRPAESIIIAYGGALHNDVSPSEERRAWSFGPQLVTSTVGRYLELDLIVAEYIKDTDTWRRLPWYKHFDPKRNPGKTTLFRLAPNAYAMIFPAARPR
jgi:hypothetical protein